MLNLLPNQLVPVNDYINKIKVSQKTMFLTPTNEHEISRIIDDLKNKRSSGYDQINNLLLKELKCYLLRPLSLIFNMSLVEGVFQNKMKSADVVPLYKSKCKDNRNNYRPISLLLTLSKLLEKLIYKRTYKFLENTGQIFEGQYGFRSKHSCENAVQNLLSDIVKNESQNKTTLAVFIDLLKAFDMLSHSILFKKLEKYRIRGIALDWYKSYLYDRSLRVKCHTSSEGVKYSDNYPVTYGAPQGSCLGPLLFSIFTNDLHLNLLYTKCILFADDTTIYTTTEITCIGA